MLVWRVTSSEIWMNAVQQSGRGRAAILTSCFLVIVRYTANTNLTTRGGISHVFPFAHQRELRKPTSLELKQHSQHGVVLELRLAKRRGVLRDEEELGWGLVSTTVHCIRRIATEKISHSQRPDRSCFRACL